MRKERQLLITMKLELEKIRQDLEQRGDSKLPQNLDDYLSDDDRTYQDYILSEDETDFRIDHKEINQSESDGEQMYLNGPTDSGDPT